MANLLKGKKVAIVATHGFEESELLKPLEALKAEGAQVEVLSFKKEELKSWRDNNWGKTIKVDHLFAEVSADDFDGVLLPGGVINADILRGEEAAVDFIAEFTRTGKPIAAICHGAWILIEADAVHGRTMTSWHSLKTDLQNAGATWVDREVVVDHGLVTSRCPADIPAFNHKMIEEFNEGKRTLRPKLAAGDDDVVSSDPLQVRH